MCSKDDWYEFDDCNVWDNWGAVDKGGHNSICKCWVLLLV